MTIIFEDTLLANYLIQFTQNYNNKKMLSKVNIIDVIFVRVLQLTCCGIGWLAYIIVPLGRPLPGTGITKEGNSCQSRGEYTRPDRREGSGTVQQHLHIL